METERRSISVEELCLECLPEYFNSEITGEKCVLQVHNCNLFNKKLFLYKEGEDTHLVYIPSKFGKGTISTMERMFDLSKEETSALVNRITDAKTTVLYKPGMEDHLKELAVDIVKRLIVSTPEGDPFWVYGSNDIPYKKEDWDNIPDSEKYVSVELISENDFKQILAN